MLAGLEVLLHEAAHSAGEATWKQIAARKTRRGNSALNPCFRERGCTQGHDTSDRTSSRSFDSSVLSARNGQAFQSHARGRMVAPRTYSAGAPRLSMELRCGESVEIVAGSEHGTRSGFFVSRSGNGLRRPQPFHEPLVSSNAAIKLAIHRRVESRRAALSFVRSAIGRRTALPRQGRTPAGRGETNRRAGWSFSCTSKSASRRSASCCSGRGSPDRDPTIARRPSCRASIARRAGCRRARRGRKH